MDTKVFLTNVENVCRLCVRSLDGQIATEMFKTNDKPSIAERILCCSSLEVSEGDGLPSYICTTCLNKLNDSFLFRNQCILANNTLRNVLGSTKAPQNEDTEKKVTTEDTYHRCGNEEDDVKEEWNQEEDEQIIDEFDNSKNGRHKQNIRKTKGKEIESNTRKAKRKITKKNVEIMRGTESKETVKIKNGCVETVSVEPDFFEIAEVKCEPLQRGKRGRPRRFNPIVEKPGNFTCEHCHRVYPSEGGWRYHIHTIHNEHFQPFICDLCGKSFKVKKNLEGHKNSIHFHLKQHLCDLCGRGFASKYALKVHKIWHNDEKNFTCDVCGSKFRTRGKMNTHRSIHGGPKKFMCEVCSREFRWKKDFEIHMRTHTGEKPYTCSHCGKSFSSLTNMKKHERNHNNVAPANEHITVVEGEDIRAFKADLIFPFEPNFTVIELRDSVT